MMFVAVWAGLVLGMTVFALGLRADWHDSRIRHGVARLARRVAGAMTMWSWSDHVSGK